MRVGLQLKAIMLRQVYEQAFTKVTSLRVNARTLHDEHQAGMLLHDLVILETGH